MDPFCRKYSLILLSFFIFFAGCATTKKVEKKGRPSPSMQAKDDSGTLLTNLDRPAPNPITDEIPTHFFEAVEKKTRTISGEPGPEYWQQQSDYQMNVEIMPDKKKLAGSGTITYYNNSPDTLQQLYLELSQNLHKKGVPRSGQAEVTGGINLESFSYSGKRMQRIQQRGQAGYVVNGTTLAIQPGEPLLPGESVTMQAKWNFTIPQKGADGRMGYNKDNLIFIAYWYPKVRVYDDIFGWFTDPFLGNAEFYNEFGNFSVTVTAPEQWIVAATGKLDNAREVLQKPVYNRLQKAHRSDKVINVADEDDFGKITQAGKNGIVSWNFSAEDVSDFAFSLTKESNWDATRTPVGDRDGDGSEDYAHIDAFYRNSAPLWKETARYEQHSIKFLSDFTGLSYPWPHMTAVEGGGIIGGGMEFPMMTLMGDYNGGNSEGLYAVTAHELAHMWIPMQLASNERRYAWMDEGTTTFNENQAKKAFFNNAQSEEDADLNDFGSYLGITGTDLEGEIMRWSDFQYNGSAYGVASYPKPASLLVTLRGLLGDKTFTDAYHTFMQRWQFKHPYPWDLFNTFEDVSGRDLDWFWRSWYYETWVLDQAVSEVTETDSGARILIQDFGQIPMPAEVQVTLADGTVISRKIKVQTWLRGATSVILTIKNDSPVTKVAIDPEHKFPDADRSNNVWER